MVFVTPQFEALDDADSEMAVKVLSEPGWSVDITQGQPRFIKHMLGKAAPAPNSRALEGGEEGR